MLIFNAQCPHASKDISPSEDHLHLYMWTNICQWPNSQLRLLKWPQHFGLFLSESNRICAILLQDLINLIFPRCGENALKEVMGKVLQKVQVGVGEDWEACKKRSVSGGGWLCMSLHKATDQSPPSFLPCWRADSIPFQYSSWIAGSSRLCPIII
jgi:hypothetical protein